jgi:DNA-directed RNA polymerase subunit K/omega
MNGLFSLKQAGMEEDSGGNMENVENLKEELEAEILQPSISNTKKSYDPLSVLHRHHPECLLDYSESVIQKLQLKSVGSSDQNHKSQPFLTQFEKTRILGFRTNQLAQGARAFVTVPPHITSTLDIAKMELEQRRLPFIVKRPMPDGTFEYWRLSDLMIL